MNIYKFSLLLIIPIIFSCSLCDKDEDVILSTSNNNLIIENYLDVKIYYHVIDRDWISLVDWVPLAYDENSIESGHLKKISYKDISTNKGRSLQKGDKVEVYWWTDEFLDKNQQLGQGGVGTTNGQDTITL